jgi:peptide/nickel transport system ATP-binding protein
VSDAIRSDLILDVRGLTIGLAGGDGEPLVSDVSLSLGRGQTIGIVGESGSGKSLTCKAILGILPETLEVRGGSIRFDGVDVTRFGHREWQPYRAERISAIFQDPGSYLNPSLRVGKQLSEVLRVRGGLSSDDAYDRAIGLFAAVGLRDPERVYRAYPFELSGGMVQRVVIAIAVALSPDLLIADEATTALDVTVQAEVLALLRRLRDERGLSLLFVSHDLAVISEVADYVIVMYQGGIVEQGPTDDVLLSPRHEYTRLLVSDHREYGLEKVLGEAAR